MLRCLGIGQHFVPVREPATNFAFQNRLLARRGQPLAVNHAHAAKATGTDLENEIGKRIMRTIGSQAVQVELGLYGPEATAKLARDVAADAVPNKGLLVFVFLADVPGLRCRVVAEFGGLQYVALVGERVAGDRRRPLPGLWRPSTAQAMMPAAQSIRRRPCASMARRSSASRPARS